MLYTDVTWLYVYVLFYTDFFGMVPYKEMYFLLCMYYLLGWFTERVKRENYCLPLGKQRCRICHGSRIHILYHIWNTLNFFSSGAPTIDKHDIHVKKVRW